MPDPYYQDDHVTIYHGDCLDVIDVVEFDVVVTDPPYGTNNDDLHGDSYFPYDVLDGEVPTVAFGSARNMVETIRGFRTPPHRVMVWAPAFRAGSQRADNIVYKFDPIYVWHPTKTEMGAAPWDDVFQQHLGRTSSIFKPVPMMRELCQVVPSGVILDPFMGSGTTLRAAKDLGRKAIGVEIEERYCEIAAQRCAQEVLAFG
jgi:DNA modification methylase